MFFGHQQGEEDEWEDQETQQPGPNAQTEQVNTTEFYELLELEKSATSEQIKKSFRKKALKQHPDKGGDPMKFKRLKEAYDTLLDPEKRQLYDDYGEEGVKNGGPPQKSGFFGFGEADNKPRKAKPKLIKLDLTLQQVFSGCVKQVSVTRFRTCTDCAGKGGHNSKKCDICKGNGVCVKLVQLGPGMYTQAQVACQTCSGTGQSFSQQDKCKFCLGKRVIQSEKKIQVGVEQGVPDAHDYIFFGQSDQYPNILAGDIYIRVNLLKHEVYERRGADLFYHKEITLLEALTGVTTTLNHLNGLPYVIATAPGEILANKDIKTIKRLGLPYYKDPSSFGHLHLEFTVIFPVHKSISQDQEKLLRSAFNYKQSNQQINTQSESACPLEQFTEQLLNNKAGNVEEQDEQQGEGGQSIGCQQQ